MTARKSTLYQVCHIDPSNRHTAAEVSSRPSRLNPPTQSLDVDLGSLKAGVDVHAFSCDVTGRYAVAGDSSGLLLMVCELSHVSQSVRPRAWFHKTNPAHVNQQQDLEYPFQRPRVFHHQGKSRVECLRWNPHVSHQDYVASVSSAQASVLVWRVDNDYRPLLAGLRKHTR